jgi:hypothetical protein
MPTINPIDLAVLRTYPQTVRRYLSIAARESVYTARVSGVTFDTASGAIIELAFTSGAGMLGEVKAGYTLDVGTTAGARDVGMLRLRKAPTAGVFYVAETAPGECNVQADHYLTVRREYRPWRVAPRLVQTDDTATEYLDYDRAYSGETIPPHANITGAAPAGFADPGQTYRTVTLDSSGSVALGAAIAGRLWEVDDGTIISGTATSTAITVRFPAATVFRYISLTVTDSNGAAHTRHYPVWVHTQPPLTAFEVTRDERADGRTMAFELFGGDGEADESILPAGALVCYWEQAEFGASPAPSAYINTFLGWAVRDSALLKLDGGRYRLEVAGAAWWLDHFDGVVQTLANAPEPDRWTAMAGLTIDRAVQFILRAYTTLGALINFYPSGMEDEAASLTLGRGSMWSQIVALAGRGAAATACDSTGGLWLRRHLAYLDADARAGRATILHLLPDDWTDAAGLLVPSEHTERVGRVEATGTDPAGTRYASRSPGLVTGTAEGAASLPPQVLPASRAQEALNALAGHHYARLNNPRGEITLRLLGNMDVIEPAWGEVVTLTWAASSVRGLTLNAARFLVQQVSIEHHNGFGKAPKAITLTLEGETSGTPGAAVEILADQVTRPETPRFPNPRQRPVQPGIGAGAARIAAFNTDGHVYITQNFTSSSPVWTRYPLGLSGTLTDFVPDPFSPRYLGTGAAVDGWIMTTTRVYRISDIFGARTITLQHTFASAGSDTLCRIETERGAPNFAAAVRGVIGVGTFLNVTTDGLTWSADIPVSGPPGAFGAAGLYVSARTPGKLLVSENFGSGIAEAKRSLDYGATLSASVSPNFSSRASPYALHVPFDSEETTAYFGWLDSTITRLYRADSTTQTDISPVDGGSFGAQFSRAVDTCPINSNRLVLAGRRNGIGGGDLMRVYITREARAGSPVWSAVPGTDSSAAGTNYNGVRCAGDNPDTFYLFGNGVIAYSADFGASIRDKRGNITSMGTVGRFVNLCGG